MDNKASIVQINASTRGSTGNIMFGIANCARHGGYEAYTFSKGGRSQRKDMQNNYFIGNMLERNISAKLNYHFGSLDSLNWFGTKDMIKYIQRINPSLIHLHNLHGDYLNLKMLFYYLKSVQIPIVWTLHDCWSFTAQCAYFDIEGCNKWKTGCHSCTQYRLYPGTRRDHSKELYEKKRELFLGMKNVTIVTCSEWLRGLVMQSYLKDYDVRVINNGVDLSIFNPHESAFREKYHIENKFIILCVAFSWGYRKGQDRIEQLAKLLDDRFQVVMVGIDKEKVSSNRIICIPKTNNQKELADIYSSADVFLNPTREDNFPTVNIEALACGLPVLSYGAGGSAEAFDESSGMVVSDETVIEALENLYRHNFLREKCVERGRRFDMQKKFYEYVQLYDDLIVESQVNI